MVMLAALIVLVVPQARGIQDDVVLPMDRTPSLFRHSPEEGVSLLPGATGRLDVATYPLWEGHHAWHGVVATDMALIAVGPNLLWRAGLWAQTVADHRNDILFRLTRLFYQFHMGADLKLGSGILSLQWIHRCSHGADGAVEGRILVRNGLNILYRWQGRWGALSLDVQGNGHVTVLGQNTDLKRQPRGLLSVATEVAWVARAPLSLVAGFGLGAGIFAEGDSWEYAIDAPAGPAGGEWLPAVTAGVRYRKDDLGLAILLHGQRILDDGVGETSNPTNLYSVRFVYDW